MECKNCNHCESMPQGKSERNERVSAFYEPLLSLFEEADIRRCTQRGLVYQLSWLQCMVCSILMMAWTMAGMLISAIPVIGEIISIIFWIFAYPYVIEIPRTLLPWKQVEKTELYLVRWKSKWGLIAAHILGFVCGYSLIVTLF